jgi:putative acetyltransferase
VRIHELAFGRPDEARLVQNLHRAGAATLSLVAVEPDGTIAGHVLFSPVTIETAAGAASAIGLGPIAVLPDRHKRGLGSLLIREGLAELRKLGHEAVVVLGHADYYPKLGFTPASAFGLRWEGGHDANFMAIELRPGALAGCAGVVRYRAEFSGL